MPQLAELIAIFEDLWPTSGAEEWDRVGLTVGSSRASISKVLLTVDITSEVLDEAKACGTELVLSHHPLLLRGVHSLSEQTLKGHVVAKAIRANVALYSAHTNADIVINGVSDVLAKSIGITNAAPLVPNTQGVGHGRIGELSSAVTLRELAINVSKILPQTSAPIRVAGKLEQSIKRVAVVAGAGDSFIQQVLETGADCLITSDLRHHVALDAITDSDSHSLTLIDISHFAAESLWLSAAANQLRDLAPNVEFVVSRVVTDPWSLTIGPDFAG